MKEAQQGRLEPGRIDAPIQRVARRKIEPKFPETRGFACIGVLMREVKNGNSGPESNPQLYAPSQRPAGSQPSTWSQTTLIVAVIGIARTSPMAPQSHPQNSNAMVTARGFKWTRRPTIAGINTLR